MQKNNKKLFVLIEEMKMYYEAIQLFKKEQTKLKLQKKDQELALLEREILPIYEKAYYNCFLLRKLGYKDGYHK